MPQRPNPAAHVLRSKAHRHRKKADTNSHWDRSNIILYGTTTLKETIPLLADLRDMMISQLVWRLRQASLKEAVFDLRAELMLDRC